MPTTYITDVSLSAEAHDRLGLAAGEELPGRYARVVSSANQDAYRAIQSALIGRGFTQEQIDGWDRRVEYNRVLGLYRIFAEQPNQSADDAWVEKLNRFSELETVPILIGGELQEPEGTTSAQRISFGALDTSDDRITMDMEW